MVFCLITLMSFGQSSPVKSFMKDLPRAQRHHVNKITIGRLPIGIVRLFVDKEYKPILKQVKKLRVLNIDNVAELDTDIMDALYAKVDKNNYQELIEIRDNGQRIFLKVKEDNDTLNELLAVVNDGDQLSIIEVKGKIKYTELEKLINTYTSSESSSTYSVANNSAIEK